VARPPGIGRPSCLRAAFDSLKGYTRARARGPHPFGGLLATRGAPGAHRWLGKCGRLAPREAPGSPIARVERVSARVTPHSITRSGTGGAPKAAAVARVLPALGKSERKVRNSLRTYLRPDWSERELKELRTLRDTGEKRGRTLR
jgi:hypothetical protein